MTITGTLDWQSGRIEMDVLLAPAAFASLYGDPGARSFTGSFDVSGTLVLDNASITQAGSRPLRIEPGATFFGDGTIYGSLLNLGGIVYVGEGDFDLVVTGDFQQNADSTLQFEISDDSPSLGVGGSAAIGGTVVYDVSDSYNPELGQEQLLVGTHGLLTWRPSCRTTTGNGSDVGHWQTKVGTYGGGGYVKVKWQAGAGNACPR